jgi:2-oxoglutarate ferredoxin oxidoreductase subunit alpha
MNKQRTVLKIAGESGMGIASVGEIITKSLQKYGFNIFAEREFPSLIKGGVQNYQINFSQNLKVRSLHTEVDVALGLDREGLKDCLHNLKEGGILIHGFDRWNKVLKDLPNQVGQKGIKMYEVPARELAVSVGGNVLMVNTVLVGFLFKILGLNLEILETQIRQTFSSKPAIVEVNVFCAKAGYNFEPEDQKVDIQKPVEKIEREKGQIVIDGNTSLVLGALQAGVRAYFAYPMSPSTSVLNYFAQTAEKTGVLVEQVEDEITVANMTIGAMHAGTRALCATSGGGYDLMTETVSLAGIIEVPLVIINVQRPGPATGLPTWTAQADLNLAIYSSHGEFARLVVAVSDPEDAYLKIQHAFNFAEKFQIPVIILSEATIAMSFTSCDEFKTGLVKIERNLVNETELDDLKSEDRFAITENGVSKRWIPGSSKAHYFANGDEHWSDGSLTEEGDKSALMQEKRNKKIKALLTDLPEPELFGSQEPDILLIGWGSTKNVVLDTIDLLKTEKPNLKIGYLHYSYLYPLKIEKLLNLIAKIPNYFILEGNYQGQFANLIQTYTHLTPAEINLRKFLKYNGRAFYVDEMVEFVLGKIK